MTLRLSALLVSKARTRVRALLTRTIRSRTDRLDETEGTWQ
jgi:hypothetical protein